MNLLLNAYGVTDAEREAVEQAVGTLGKAQGAALSQIAKTVHGLMDGAFPAQESQRRFDALVVQLGQRLREHFPHLADGDDEEAWKRLAVAYAFTPKKEGAENADDD